MKVAFIGLGVMGYPMAGHLARAGHQVTVFNRTAAKAERWIGEHGGRRATMPREAAAAAEVVLCCVGNDDDLREVTQDPEVGAFAGLADGALFVDHTTTSATVARELDAKARQRGAGFLDAPVSGGQAGAENGQLTIMVGGADEDYGRVEPIIDCYARSSRLMGPVGAGQLTKMVNQICIAGILEGLAEALHFALAAGLEAEAVVDVIAKGAAQSWQMDNRWRTMVDGEFEFGFAVDWMRKDLGIAQDEARRNGAMLPLVGAVDQFYAEIQAMGGHRWDTSSLIARLEQRRRETPG